jgi:hypothetical protein
MSFFSMRLSQRGRADAAPFLLILAWPMTYAQVLPFSQWLRPPEGFPFGNISIC